MRHYLTRAGKTVRTFQARHTQLPLHKGELLLREGGCAPPHAAFLSVAFAAGDDDRNAVVGGQDALAEGHVRDLTPPHTAVQERERETEREALEVDRRE